MNTRFAIDHENRRGAGCAIFLIAWLVAGSFVPIAKAAGTTPPELIARLDYEATAIEELVVAQQFDAALERARAILVECRATPTIDRWRLRNCELRVEQLQKVTQLPIAAKARFAAWPKLRDHMRELLTARRYDDLVDDVESGAAYWKQTLGDRDPLAMRFERARLALAVRHGHLDRVRREYVELLERQRLVFGTPHPETLLTRHHIAQYVDLLGARDIPRAERELIAVCEERRKLLGEGHVEVAESLEWIGIAKIRREQPAEAVRFLRRSHAIFETELGPDHPDTLRTLKNLGAVLTAIGDSEAAERVVLEWRTRAERSGERDPAGEHEYLLQLARQHRRRGELDRAANLVERAIELGRELDARLRVPALLQLAAIRTEERRSDLAAELYRDAAKLAVDKLGPDHPLTLAVRLSTAQLELARERPEVALRAARDVATRAKGASASFAMAEVAIVASRLEAECSLAEGDDDAAERAFMTLIASAESTARPRHPTILRAHYQLAMLDWCHRRYQEAERHLRAVVENETPSLANLGRDDAVASGPSFALAAAEHLAVLLATRGQSEAAWRLLEATRSRAMIESMQVAESLPRTPEQRAERAQRVEALRRAERDWRAAADADKPALEDRYYAIKRQIAVADEKLLDTNGVAAERIELADVQQALTPVQALVTWIDLDASDAGPIQDKAVSAVPAHWAVVVRSSGAPKFVPLADAGAPSWSREERRLGARCRECLRLDPARGVALASRGIEFVRRTPTIATGLDATADLADRLYAQRIAMIVAQEETPIGEWIVLPNAAMRGVPLEFAFSSRGEIPPIVYGYSAVVQMRLERKEHSHGAGAIVLGNPTLEAVAGGTLERPDHGAYVTVVKPASVAERIGLRVGDVIVDYAGRAVDGLASIVKAIHDHRKGEDSLALVVWRHGELLRLTAPPGALGARVDQRSAVDVLEEQQRLLALTRSGSSAGYGPLPYAEAEARGLHAMFDSEASQPISTLLVGDDAVRSKLVAMLEDGRLSRCRFLHFATHAEFIDSRPLDSALILGSRDGDIEAGRLTVSDIISSWQLDADLITLSGCQTALDREVSGEGWVGLSQALIIAGARSVVSSLWQVNDKATSLLMLRFYYDLLDRALPKHRALAEAKDWLRGLTFDQLRAVDFDPMRTYTLDVDRRDLSSSAVRPFAHPYYWSGFVLIGASR